MIDSMWAFGEHVGIAFQIKDDLFDYQRSNATGKPNGTDIRDQKMTLPLIYLLNHSDYMEKRWIINTVKNHHDDAAQVSKLIGKVVERGGIDYANEQMLQYRGKALEILETFPANSYRTSLEQLVLFTTERNT